MGANVNINNNILALNKEGWMTSRNLADLTEHEVGHMLTFKGKTIEELISMDKSVNSISDIGKGISRYAETDGLEALSEGFVLLNRGETISNTARSAINTYMGLDI